MDDLQLPKLRELAAPAVVMSPLARIRLCAVRGVPAVGQIQDRSLDPLKQLETARPLQACEAALIGETEEVDIIVLGREDTVDERFHYLLPLAFGDQRVRKRGLARADKGSDSQAAPGERDQRQGADELVPTEGNLDRQPVALAVMAPPLDQPAV